MSVKVMSMVFDRYPEGGNERVLALALADHAHEDGTHIFPTVETLARKSFQSPRTVQRLLAKMVSNDWLQLVNSATGRRGLANEYRINPAWIRGGAANSSGDKLAPDDVGEVVHTGDRLAPHKKGARGDNSGVTGDKSGTRGDTAMSPKPSEPSRTLKTPLPPANAGGDRDAKQKPAKPDTGGDGFDAFWARYPRKKAEMRARRQWTRLNPNPALQMRMLAALAAQMRSSEWNRDGGRWVPLASTWLHGERWRDVTDDGVPSVWWESGEGIKAMGASLGLHFSLDALGNAYTDDQQMAHWRAYRATVFAAAGDGPWSARRAA